MLIQSALLLLLPVVITRGVRLSIAFLICRPSLDFCLDFFFYSPAIRWAAQQVTESAPLDDLSSGILLRQTINFLLVLL